MNAKTEQLTHALDLLLQTAFPSRAIVADVVLENETPNFVTRATRSRIWVRVAVDVCKRFGVELPHLPRVTKAERAAFAYELAQRIREALQTAAVDAIEVTIEPSKIYFTPSLNTRLTPAKLVRTTHFQGVNQMLQRLAIIASILAICLASVSCVAHTVYTF